MEYVLRSLIYILLPIPTPHFPQIQMHRHALKKPSRPHFVHQPPFPFCSAKKSTLSKILLTQPSSLPSATSQANGSMSTSHPSPSPAASPLPPRPRPPSFFHHLPPPPPPLPVLPRRKTNPVPTSSSQSNPPLPTRPPPTCGSHLPTSCTSRCKCASGASSSIHHRNSALKNASALTGQCLWLVAWV